MLCLSFQFNERDVLVINRSDKIVSERLIELWVRVIKPNAVDAIQQLENTITNVSMLVMLMNIGSFSLIEFKKDLGTLESKKFCFEDEGSLADNVLLFFCFFLTSLVGDDSIFTGKSEFVAGGGEAAIGGSTSSVMTFTKIVVLSCKPFEAADLIIAKENW